jgi:molybdate transport system substrate-binding protein
MKRFVTHSIASLLVAMSVSVVAADLTVFAAASLKEALDENVKSFNAATGHRVRVSYAGSNVLAMQIENGAPADLFISADEGWMDHASRASRIVASTRRDLLRNELVLIAPKGQVPALKIGPQFPLAPALKGGRLALADPDSVPAGKYAKEVLIKLGAWESVAGSLARAENVRAALAFVARAEAPLGIVYRTDALAEPRVAVVDVFSAQLHAPIVYPAALVTGGKPEARLLLDHLGGQNAREVWARRGFSMPK